jgi:hypothetical protein
MQEREIFWREKAAGRGAWISDERLEGVNASSLFTTPGGLQVLRFCPTLGPRFQKK